MSLNPQKHRNSVELPQQQKGFNKAIEPGLENFEIFGWIRHHCFILHYSLL